METTYLAHHGIKGMRWGVRRYQNADGSLTSAGRKRVAKNWNPSKASDGKYMGAKARKAKDGGVVVTESYKTESSKKGMSEKTKKNLKTAAKVGAVVAGSALAAYGAYKLHGYIRNENVKIAKAKAAVASSSAMHEHLSSFEDSYSAERSRHASEVFRARENVAKSEKVLNAAKERVAAASSRRDEAIKYAKEVENYKPTEKEINAWRNDFRYKNDMSSLRLYSDEGVANEIKKDKLYEANRQITNRYNALRDKKRSVSEAEKALENAKFKSDYAALNLRRYDADYANQRKRAEGVANAISRGEYARVYDENANVNFRTAAKNVYRAKRKK